MCNCWIFIPHRDSKTEKPIWLYLLWRAWNVSAFVLFSLYLSLSKGGVERKSLCGWQRWDVCVWGSRLWSYIPASEKYTIAATGTQHSVQDGTTITGKKLREFAAVLSDDFAGWMRRPAAQRFQFWDQIMRKSELLQIFHAACERGSPHFFGKDRFVSVFTVKNRALFYEQRDGISGTLYDWHAGCEGLSQN